MEKMNFKIPGAVKKAMDIMNQNGFECYIVGGSVRDFLMGKKPSDFDITTNATPEETKKCFSDFRVIETGIEHGTVTVLIHDEPIEITTYRIDGKYVDNRHPESVSFTVNLAEDLSRRDFTVNALAYDGGENIVDLFSGKEDLKNKIIRCVGEPDRRFSEDGLRILRALRFSSVLDFEIDADTEKSIRKNKELLRNISTERILVELTKLLCGVRAKEILMEYREVFEVVIPEISGYLKYDENIFALEKLAPEKELRFAAFFAESENPKKTLKALKFDNKSKELISGLVTDLKKEMMAERIFLKKMLISRDFSYMEKLIALKKAFGDDSLKCDHMKNLLDDIKKNAECVRISQLEIDGNLVKSIDGVSGKEIGILLNKALDMVIEGKIPNDKDKLMDYLKNFTKNH